MKHTTSFLLMGIDSLSTITLLDTLAKQYAIILESKDFFIKALHDNKATLRAFIDEVHTLFGAKLLLTTNLAKTALTLLKNTNQKLSTAESCTGGLLAYEFTQISGASEVFLGGVISYDNSIKESWLSVDSQDLQSFGAVSEVVVSQMCKGILHLSGADFALATSGIAGPNGGSAQKPVGLVYIGVQQRGNVAKIERHIFAGNRKSVQKQAAQTAILIDDPCMPNFMVDPKTLQCTGLIDLGRLGTADRYADLALMIANAEENWAAPDEAERAFAVLFNVLGIEAPDRERLAFYLRLDPLTWG